MTEDTSPAAALLRGCAELDALPGHITDAQAHSFLSQFPFETIMRYGMHRAFQTAMPWVSEAVPIYKARWRLHPAIDSQRYQTCAAVWICQAQQ